MGDRLDNDIRPAQAAGLATAWIRRGPWGFIQDDAEAARACRFRVDSLLELPPLVAAHNENQPESWSSRRISGSR